MSAQATAIRILGLVLFGGLAATGLGYYWSFSPKNLRKSSKTSLRQSTRSDVDFRVLIHGGAGVIGRGIDSKPFYEALSAIINGISNFVDDSKRQSADITAVDIVEYAVKLLENEPLFNAGKGAVFTADETHELEASIMDGSNLKCGAVSMITKVKNPISLARTVMDKTVHNYLVGEGAERLAEQYSLELVDPSYFSTENRRDQLRRAKLINKSINDHDMEKDKKTEDDDKPPSKEAGESEEEEKEKDKEKEGNNNNSKNSGRSNNLRKRNEEENAKDKPDSTSTTVKNTVSAHRHVETREEEEEAKEVSVDDPPGGTGTVGAVCMYKGHVAAATSTGGLTNKMAGRIGDSPIIGAGTYANDATCAVSATGKGEEFMRHVAAYDVSSRIEIGRMDLANAVRTTVHVKLPKESGGLIVINTRGDYSMDFNSKGMFRGICDSTGDCYVGIWEELIPVTPTLSSTSAGQGQDQGTADAAGAGALKQPAVA